MTAPDEPSGGDAAAGPPPNQYGQPAGSYQAFDQPQYRQPQQTQHQQPQYQQPAYQQQGPPPGPYGYPGGPYGPRLPRETGALVVCIVLLVLALIGSFLASAAVYGNLTDSSSSSPVVPGAAQPSDDQDGGTGPAGGSSGTSGNSNSIKTNFPLYPHSRKVDSATPYLGSDAVIDSTATTYLVHAGVATVFRWYRAHLRADHLTIHTPIVSRDYTNRKIISVGAPLDLAGVDPNSGAAAKGYMTIQHGIHKLTVIQVNTFG